MGQKKGFKHSEDTKISIAAKLTGYKRTDEEIEKSAKNRTGRKRSLESRKKMAEAQKKRWAHLIKRVKAKRYKGKDAKYVAKHMAISKLKGREKKCEHCGTETAKRYEWSNKDHKYTRNPDDYQRLCCSCHYKYDVANGLRPKSYFKKQL